MKKSTKIKFLLLLLFPFIILYSIRSEVNKNVDYGHVNDGPKISSVTKNQVSITFDDLPSSNDQSTYVIPRLIKTLNKHRVPAHGFVNEGKLFDGGKLDSDKVNLLENWLDQGLYLGNHSYSHVNIEEVTLAEYKTDILKGEKITKQLLKNRSESIKYYRHPYLRTGPTLKTKIELDSFLMENGYTVAPVTMDNNDYVFAKIYSRAKGKGDRKTMQYIAEEYLKYMESIFNHFETLSTNFLGYNLNHILLLHANELNADHLEDLLNILKRKNYTFISLEEALKDPAYQLSESPSKKGISWLHRWMLAKGKKLSYEPSESDTIQYLYSKY
jgi:peptidoglycan/xylan/chitin deacetylase (PgdA/CDA1 family)